MKKFNCFTQIIQIFKNSFNFYDAQVEFLNEFHISTGHKIKKQSSGNAIRN